MEVGQPVHGNQRYELPPGLDQQLIGLIATLHSSNCF